MQETPPFSKVISFDCNGDWKKKNIEFNPNGFHSLYNSGLGDNFRIDEINCNLFLFGKKCDFFLALQKDCDWLFSVCSSFMMDLHSLEISSYKKKLSKKYVTDMEKAAMNSREEVTRFLYYTDYYLKVCLAEKNYLAEDEFLKLEYNLNSLRRDIQYISKFILTDEIILNSSSVDDKMFPSISYNLIHCCLDFQWYFILIKYKLNEIKYLGNYRSETVDDYSNKTDTFLMLMIELFLMSVIKYKWLKEGDYLEDIFPCPCIKELWVLLFKHLGLEVFWDYFNQVLSAVSDIKFPPDNEALKTLCILSLNHLGDAAVDKEFAIYFLRDISKLKDHIICKVEYPLNTGRFIPFFDNVKRFLNSNPSEKSLRLVFRSISFIMNNWELEKEHVIVLLWEFLYKRIDLPLCVTGEMTKEMNFFDLFTQRKYQYLFHITCDERQDLSEYRIIEAARKIAKDDRSEWETSKFINLLKSCKTFLMEIKKRFIPNEEADHEENSFGIFLRIVAIQVPKKRSQGSGMKNFHSRIYLKYDVLKKFHTFGELALYRTSSLFLTTAIAYGVEKEIKKLRELMVARKSDELGPKEKIVKWKTLAACLLLSAENGCNWKEIAGDIISEIRLALTEKDTTLIPIFIDCIKIAIENRNNYLSFLTIVCTFIGDWIGDYLALLSGNERGSFLSLFDPLLEDLKNEREWGNAEDAERLESKLCSYILPFVKRYLHSSVAKTAGLFLSYFIKTRKYAHSYSLYNVWLHSNDVDTDVARKFVKAFYEIEGNVTKLHHCMGDYDVDIIQIFIKEHLFNEKTHGSYRLKKIVQSLPRITRYISDIRYDWSDDYALDDFIRLFGLILNKNLLPSEKSNIKELFNKCFSKLEVWIEVGLASKTKSIVNNIYRCSSLIIAECYCLLLEENRSSLLKTIVNNVFLPVKKGKNLYELPSVFANAACENLPLFIRGLFRLNKRNNNSCTRNTLISVIEYSFPTDPYYTEDFFKKHPFYQCLLDPELTVQFTILLRDLFFSKWHKTSNSQTENVIRLFSFVSLPSLRDSIFSICISPLLHLIMDLDYSCKLLKFALDYIEKCTRDSSTCRQDLTSALEKIVETEISACSENLSKLLRHLRVVCPREISGLSSVVKQQKENAERDNDTIKLSYLKSFERDLKNSLI